MTTDDLTRMCPPPEGMEWHEDGYGGFIAQAPNRTLRIDPEAEERIRVSAWNVDDNVHFFATLTDLPAAYRRAMVAVGLASPWTSEVPTQPGHYLVRWAETKGRPIVWTLEAGVWYGPSGVVSRPPPHGSSFLNIADLKESP